MRHSLSRKLVLLLVVFVVAISGVALAVGYRVVNSMNEQHYLSKADEIGATVARVVNNDDMKTLVAKMMDVYRTIDEPVMSDEWGSPQFEAYVGRFSHLTQTPEYQSLLAQLRSLQEPLDVDCLYIAVVDPVTQLFLYLVDAAEEDPCPIGTADPLYDFNRGLLADPAVGFPAYVTNTEEYGWLVTAGSPVYGADGSVIGYAMADLSMETIKQRQQGYFLALAGGLLALTAILGAAAILYVRSSIIRPLDALSEAAKQYCAPGQERQPTFEALNIHTKDEIESLHQSMIQMERDIDMYINNLVETRAKLKDTKIEADAMSELAHRDALTGIRNKLAYDQLAVIIDHDIAQGKAVFGIAVIDLNDLKKTNDEYGHDCGNVSLKLLSETACSVFEHSAVFRIGGDEFAVVLRGADYVRSANLVTAFKESVWQQQNNASAEPWERISAAIGFAAYDPSLDNDVASVFRRADEQMYLCKRSMKGEDTR